MCVGSGSVGCVFVFSECWQCGCELGLSVGSVRRVFVCGQCGCELGLCVQCVWAVGAG